MLVSTKTFDFYFVSVLWGYVNCIDNNSFIIDFVVHIAQSPIVKLCSLYKREASSRRWTLKPLRSINENPQPPPEPSNMIYIMILSQNPFLFSTTTKYFTITRDSSIVANKILFPILQLFDEMPIWHVDVLSAVSNKLYFQDFFVKEIHVKKTIHSRDPISYTKVFLVTDAYA